MAHWPEAQEWVCRRKDVPETSLIGAYRASKFLECGLLSFFRVFHSDFCSGVISAVARASITDMPISLDLREGAQDSSIADRALQLEFRAVVPQLSDRQAQCVGVARCIARARALHIAFSMLHMRLLAFTISDHQGASSPLLATLRLVEWPGELNHMTLAAASLASQVECSTNP